VDGNERDDAPASADAGAPAEPSTDSPARLDEARPDDARPDGAGLGPEGADDRRAKVAPAPTAGGAPKAAPAPAPGPPVYGAARAAQPKIFDLPDKDGTRKGEGNGNGPLVLGGAAAEGRTTGSTPRIGGQGPSTPPSGENGADTLTERGRHFASRVAAGDLPEWWVIAAVAVPVVALVLLIGSWAIDTAALSGQVMRNVEVDGHAVGGLGEASLPEVMDELNSDLAERAVVIMVPEPQAGRSAPTQRSYETTAGELGLAVDAEATAEAALDAGRSDSLLTRPFSWLRSFFSPRQVDVQYSVNESQVVAKLLELQGTELLAPRDPTIQPGEAGWVAVPGTAGEGVDTDEIVDELPEAAAADPGGAIELDVDIVPVKPRFSDEEAQQLADKANSMTGNGLTLTAGEASRDVPAEQVRRWIEPTTKNGKLELIPRPDVVTTAVDQVFADIDSEPVDARFDLQGGTPVVVPSQNGITCCGDNSADIVWRALSDEQQSAELEVQVTEPRITTETAEGLGITQAVGGNHAWRDGQATTAGPGFTTWHDCCAARVANIHRMADLVRGAVILPGETFSVNDHVGERTLAKGFVPAGAIREGQHVDEVGGGVSQFATTTFNAAYFAGLDIPVSQAHTEYFPRYPLGREATMGYPNPDLQIHNNTPYGVLIWTSYTDTSLTVTMYSSPHATAAQTGISESMSGACRNVTTTRTRTFPDGTTDTDTFTATYRPGPGQGCHGPLPPPSDG
jgi:vancomycin resistance protein YoaR